MATIAVHGTLDSKGAEHAFVAERIRALLVNFAGLNHLSPLVLSRAVRAICGMILLEMMNAART